MQCHAARGPALSTSSKLRRQRQAGSLGISGCVLKAPQMLQLPPQLAVVAQETLALAMLGMSRTLQMMMCAPSLMLRCTALCYQSHYILVQASLICLRQSIARDSAIARDGYVDMQLYRQLSMISIYHV